MPSQQIPPRRPSTETSAALTKCAKKVILLGHFGVGKSSLVKRFVHSIFSSEYQTTIGVKIDKKVLLTPTHEMKMILWDIEGGPDQTALPSSYFMGAHGVLYVCDMTRPSTFKDLEETLPQLGQKSRNVPMIVIGNKMDLIPQAQLEELQDSQEAPFDFLSSASTGQGVEAAFQALAERILAP